MDAGAIVSNFEKEAGVNFTDCGTGGIVDCAMPLDYFVNPDSLFREHSKCILNAWTDCHPAKTVLDWYNLSSQEDNPNRVMYILPRNGKCTLVIFESNPEFSRVECSALATKGVCGVLEPQDCTLIETF